MLTGQRVEVTCDPQKVTAGDLFQVIFKKIFLKISPKKKKKTIYLVKLILTSYF